MAVERSHLTVRDWPEGERPREKIANLGAEQLSESELVAILLRVGSQGEDVVSLALKLLTENDGLAGLSRLSIHELSKTKGVAGAKAAALVAAFELGRRALMAGSEGRTRIRSAHDVATYMGHRLRGYDQERLLVVLLSTRNDVIGVREVQHGNISSAIVRPAEVFKDAIREGAASIIIVHNHPSGDPSPSADDVRVTRDLVSAGKLLEIEVLDHLVIGDSGRGYVSLRERRLGFEPA